MVHELRNSKVETTEAEVYDLDPDVIGTFDVVLFLGVLYHLPHPLLALEKVASVEMCIRDRTRAALVALVPAVAVVLFLAYRRKLISPRILIVGLLLGLIGMGVFSDVYKRQRHVRSRRRPHRRPCTARRARWRPPRES